MRDDPGVALQYTAPEGIPSVREYLLDRQEQLQGGRPELDELMVTSGGMECIALLGASVIEPGDTVAVEAPTYLGALMAFAGARPSRTDPDGRRRARRRRVRGAPERRAAPEGAVRDPRVPEPVGPHAAARPPPRAGRPVPPPRRADPRGRRLPRDPFEGEPLPSLWSLGPDTVLQAGTFSKVLSPGVRLGWAAGPARRDRTARERQADDRPVRGRARPADRRGVRPRRAVRARRPASRERCTRRTGGRSTAALREHMPDGLAWSARPAGSSPG